MKKNEIVAIYWLANKQNIYEDNFFKQIENKKNIYIR